MIRKAAVNQWEAVEFHTCASPVLIAGRSAGTPPPARGPRFAGDAVPIPIEPGRIPRLAAPGRSQSPGPGLVAGARRAVPAAGDGQSVTLDKVAGEQPGPQGGDHQSCREHGDEPCPEPGRPPNPKGPSLPVRHGLQSPGPRCTTSAVESDQISQRIVSLSRGPALKAIGIGLATGYGGRDSFSQTLGARTGECRTGHPWSGRGRRLAQGGG